MQYIAPYLGPLYDLVRLLPVDAETVVAGLRIALGRIERANHRRQPAAPGTGTRTVIRAATAVVVAVVAAFAETLPQRARS